MIGMLNMKAIVIVIILVNLKCIFSEHRIDIVKAKHLQVNSQKVISTLTLLQKKNEKF